MLFAVVGKVVLSGLQEAVGHVVCLCDLQETPSFLFIFWECMVSLRWYFSANIVLLLLHKPYYLEGTFKNGIIS